MNTSTQTTITLKAFDMELKAILEKDIAQFKVIQSSKDNQHSKQLIAA